MSSGWQARHPYTEQLWQAARDIMAHDLDGGNRAVVVRFQQDITKILQDMEQQIITNDAAPETALFAELDKVAMKVSPKRLHATIPLENKSTRRAVRRVVDAVRETLDEHIPSGVHEHSRALLLERLDETELAISQSDQLTRA